MAPVILFDLASKTNTCWNFFVWKTRLVLNYKQIDYQTKFMEYPDLAPYLTSLGVPPNREGTAYTCPTIKISDEFVVDSKVIAAELERRYPEPSLHLDAPELAEVEAAVLPALRPLIMVIMPRIPRHLLKPPSAEYLSQSALKDYGKSLDEIENERGGEAQFELAKESFKGLEAILKRHEGPFVLGKHVSYADFIIVSALSLLKAAGEDIYSKVVDMFPVFAILYGACKLWVERNDY